MAFFALRLFYFLAAAAFRLDDSLGEPDFQKLKEMAGSKMQEDRQKAVQSPDLAELFRVKPEEAMEIFRRLAADESFLVRLRALASPAWHPLMDEKPHETMELFEKLSKDKHWMVRVYAVKSPVCQPKEDANVSALASSKNWIDRMKATRDHHLRVFIGAHSDEGLSIFQGLAKDPDVRVRTALVQCDAWASLLRDKYQEGEKLFEDLIFDPESDEARASDTFPDWERLVKTAPTKWFPRYRIIMQDLLWEALVQNESEA